ncbi:MAG: hypothetical protein RI560_04390 [Natronomonas sp.]|uniref:hypothetical protein n=1 Tax=Natronomonas sp. TaxID=2184060 RepID=UPI0028702AB2|nr:hypothetical protein [Natronomonas sp.]MDR9380895.1 hypothetical protein [Natronomonas sp.]MDR9431875.1 hypothetical protein [Natronomonas sp.]
MTELLLTWLGSVALLATIGLFKEFADRWTRALVEFSAVVLWSLFAVSAMDVIVPSGASTPVSQPMYPLVALGIGFALVTFAYFLYDLTTGIGAEARETDLLG